VAHAALAFEAYEDVDINISYYQYYKPGDEYMNFMDDYRDHPEKYTSDPALYSNNELGLSNRESYFEAIGGGIGADPQVISLTRGEAITVSNYSYDPTNLIALMRTLETGGLATNKDAQALVEAMRAYSEGQDIDAPQTFDNLVYTIASIIAIGRETGHNPADGPSEGGVIVNRELYNQFRNGGNSQTPNNFYTVEITADELANMQKYLADPSNNYYSLLAKNCAGGAVDIWNATLSDRPELAITANLTGLSTEPESLYFAIGGMTAVTGKTYEPGVEGKEEGGGVNFYPRTVHCAKEEPEPEPEPEPKEDAQVTKAPAARKLTYDGSAQKLVKAGKASGGTMAYSLDGENFGSAIPTGVDAGKYVVRYKALGDGSHDDSAAGSVTVTIAKAPAPTLTGSQKAKAVAGIVYDGTKQALVSAPKKLPAGYTGVRYSVDGGATWTKGVPKGKKVGTYAVKVRYVGDGNHTSFVAKAIKARVLPVASAAVATHVQRKGWVEPAGAGRPCGSTGESLRMEAVRIDVPDKSISGGIEYRSHVQTHGWERSWSRDGAVSGTEGESKRLEAIQIRLHGDMAKKYDVYYRVHAQRYGWMGWARNGQRAGTAGMSLRLESLQVVLVKKGAPAPAATYKGVSQAYPKPFAQ
jgi:hypothetical protein